MIGRRTGIMGERGRNEFCLEQLTLLLASYFPGSATRARAMHGLSSLVKELEAGGIAAQLCVKGSFLSAELNPDYLEIEIIVPANIYLSCSRDQLDILDRIREDKRIGEVCLCNCRLRIGEVEAAASADEFWIYVEPDALDLTYNTDAYAD